MAEQRVCVCGHRHGQHEIRSGGLFGCYLHGCLCTDFDERADACDYCHEPLNRCDCEGLR